MHEASLHPGAGQGVHQFIQRLRHSGSAGGALLALIVLCVTFSLLTDSFLEGANLTNVAVQSTILLLIALPMTLIIMTEGLDLSMGAVLTLANVVLALVAVLGSVYPVVTVLLAWQFLGARLKPIQYVGVALALGGVAAIVA